jgi:hypothetical protein
MARSRKSRFGLVLAGLVLLVYAIASWPHIQPGVLPGGDAEEYAHLAESLLHGSFVVDYDGGPPRLTRFTPGFSAMLTPAVALGGLESAVWVSYISALALGTLIIVTSARVGGGLAAPLALVATLFTPIGLWAPRVIMSDLPATTFIVAQAAVLAFVGGLPAAFAAGLLGGTLAWLRPASVVFIAAGLAGLSAMPRTRLRLAAYLAGAAPPLLSLGAWQWLVYGSPLVTSYQGFGAGPNASGSIAALFSVKYIFGPPWNAYSQGPLPNGLVYPGQLLGIDSLVSWPLLGLIGLLSAANLARSNGVAASVGRFTLAVNVSTLLVYLPYFFREERFLMPAATLNGITAAVLVASIVSRASTALSLSRARARPEPTARSQV